MRFCQILFFLSPYFLLSFLYPTRFSHFASSSTNGVHYEKDRCGNDDDEDEDGDADDDDGGKYGFFDGRIDVCVTTAKGIVFCRTVSQI